MPNATVRTLPALDAARRRKLLDNAAAAYDTLSADAEGAIAYREELATLEGTLADGLEPGCGPGSPHGACLKTGFK